LNFTNVTDIAIPRYYVTKEIDINNDPNYKDIWQVQVLEQNGDLSTMNFTRYLKIDINNLYIQSEYLNITALGAYNHTVVFRMDIKTAYTDLKYTFKYYLRLIIIGVIGV